MKDQDRAAANVSLHFGSLQDWLKSGLPISKLCGQTVSNRHVLLQVMWLFDFNEHHPKAASQNNGRHLQNQGDLWSFLVDLYC